MLSEPLSVTYNGSAKSLARLGVDDNGSHYATADGEFELSISSFSEGDVTRCEILFTRVSPDPTPTNAFDAYRRLPNSFGLVYEFDTQTRANSAVDIPLLRTALLAFVDSTLQGKVIAGEK